MAMRKDDGDRSKNKCMREFGKKRGSPKGESHEIRVYPSINKGSG